MSSSSAKRNNHKSAAPAAPAFGRNDSDSAKSGHKVKRTPQKSRSLSNPPRSRVERANKAPKGTAQERCLKALARFSSNYTGKLKRSHRGGVSVSWVCRQAGIPNSTVHADDVLLRAVLDLAAIHGVEGDDLIVPEVPNSFSSLEKIEAIGASLAEGRLIAPTSTLTVEWIASATGISKYAIYEDRVLLAAVRDVRSKLTSPVDPNIGINEAPTSSMPDAPLDDSVEAALISLNSYDAELEQTANRVPSISGRPVLKRIAKHISCKLSAFSHPAAMNRLLEIARRHGLRSECLSSAKSLRSAAIILLADEVDTLLLREESFPTSVEGGIDLEALTAEIGVGREMAFDRKFRADAIAGQSRLLHALGLPSPSRDELEVMTTMSLLNVYAIEVANGARTFPMTPFGILIVGALERELNLIPGISARYPAIGERMQVIAAPTGAELVADRKSRVEERRVAYLVARLETRGDEMLASGDKVAIKANGNVSLIALERGLQCKFNALFNHDAVQKAVDQLVAKVGTAGKPARTAADVLVDQHCGRVRARVIPYPADALRDDQIVRSIVGRDTGIICSDITTAQLARVRTAIRGTRKATDPEKRYASCTRGMESLLTRALALTCFDKGLPEDPLMPGIADLVVIAIASGINADSLAHVKSYQALIAEKTASVGLLANAHPALQITYSDLLATGVEAATALPGHDSNRSRAMAKTRAVFESIMISAGKSAHEVIGMELFADAIQKLPVDDVASHLNYWRSRFTCLILEASEGADLATTLKFLCRATGRNPSVLIGECGLPDIVRQWILGHAEPAWCAQEHVDRLEAIFQLTPGALTTRINGDHRKPGRRAPEPVSYEVRIHLPHRFWSYPLASRLTILNEIADSHAAHNDPKSLRRRVLNQDFYRLPHKRWPPHLKKEFKAFLAAKDDSGCDDDFDDDDLFSDEEEPESKNPLTRGGKNRYKSFFEEFFGFLHLPKAFAKEQTLIPAGTPEWRKDAALARARGVKYERRPGLDIPVKYLSMGLLALWPIVDAFLSYKRNRAGHFDHGTLSFVNQCQVAVRSNGVVRTDRENGKSAADFLEWWHSKQSIEVKARLLLPEPSTGELAHLQRCDEALRKYDKVYGKLKKRRHAKGRKRLQQGRDPFIPILAVLEANTPAAVYRILIREMIANRPPLTRMRERHLHDRDCLLMLILFQTFLRIKNIAQLTYKEDGTGQLFYDRNQWHVKIHKSRFKNEHGFYFRNGEYFEMPLRDEDGLYDIIKRYLGNGREFIRLSKSSVETKRRNSLKAQCEAAPEADGIAECINDEPDTAGEKYAVFSEDDEDDDMFGDYDDDGEPKEARFFCQIGGGQFQPSQLAGRFRLVTYRYIAESPYRGRGLKNLRGHGPHAIRHIGATDALKTTGSWEKAAQVIHDSLPVVRRIYVRFTPADQGKRAAETAEAGRALPPEFALGSGLIRTAPLPRILHNIPRAA